MPKTIRVEFELNLKDVAAMMKAGTAKTAKLSEAEIETMAKSGALRAGDLLGKKEAATMGVTIAKIKLSQPLVAQLAKLSNVKTSVKMMPPKAVVKMVPPKAVVKMHVPPIISPAIVAGGGRPKTTRKG